MKPLGKGENYNAVYLPLIVSKTEPCSNEHLMLGVLLSKKHFLVNLEIVGAPKAKHI